MSVSWAKMIVMKRLPHVLMLWGERTASPVPVWLDTQEMASHVQVSVFEHSVSGGASPYSDCGRFLPLIKSLQSPKRAPRSAMFEFR